jgi:cytochrome c556
MENAGMWRQLALVVLAIGFVSGCVRINDDLGQVFRYKHPKIEARKKVMRSIAGSLKNIKIATEAGGGVGPMRKIKWAAQDIAKNARKIRGAFGHKTMSGVTTATSKVWDNWSGFTQTAGNLAASAEILAMAADGGDMSGVKNGIKTVGANCGKCHKAFLVKKK